MVWIMLATLVVVFVVGFRILTSDSRRAIKRLSERLGITLVPVESMIDQFGKTPGNEFIRYLERPDEAHLQNAAQVLLIWQVCIVNGSEENLHTWHRLLQSAWRHRLPMRKSASRWVLCARWSQTRRNLTPSSCATTSFSCRKRACFTCTDITNRDEEYKVSSLDLYHSRAQHHFINNMTR
jgi:hypothetical protein